MIRFREGNIVLSEDLYDNFVTINNDEYLLSYLNPNQPFNKGANSNVFIVSDPEGETEDIIIKICKAPYYPYSRDKRIKRFQREIKAFKLAKQNEITGIIKYYSSGTIHIDGFNFLYILMEKASGDLASYLEHQKFNFTLNQRVSFCINLINSFRKLHEAGIYHRDIKHDNILVVDDELKIGDLGLVSFQD
ncbi:MAG: protein kinase family protein, partial [Alphaproteobacteria bacterium]